MRNQITTSEQLLYIYLYILTNTSNRRNNDSKTRRPRGAYSLKHDEDVIIQVAIHPRFHLHTSITTHSEWIKYTESMVASSRDSMCSGAVAARNHYNIHSHCQGPSQHPQLEHAQIQRPLHAVSVLRHGWRTLVGSSPSISGLPSNLWPRRQHQLRFIWKQWQTLGKDCNNRNQ